jgi:hypothetical protein
MELTYEEKRIVMEYRAVKERAEKHERDTLHLLDVASRFKQWMTEKGAGATYSTFCNDFEYEAREGEDRPKLYENALEIISTARELTRN